MTETIHQKLSIHKEYNGKNRERKKKGLNSFFKKTKKGFRK